MTSVDLATFFEVSLLGIARILSLSFGGALVVLVVSMIYRWYSRERIPSEFALLIGLGTVAFSLNTAATLGSFLGGETNFLTPKSQFVNLVTLGISGLASLGGAHLGDKIATDVFSRSKSVDTEITRFVRGGGRTITVELPDEFDDIGGYDPVDPKTKKALAGTELVFPKRLTVSELRDRVVERIKKDYGIGHVDLEIDYKGEVEYIALGGRVSGLGPTLPPGHAAVAVRADPAFASGTGDFVQIWEPKHEGVEKTEARQVATAGIRGTSSDIVTLALDADDAEKLDTDTRYRLVTLPSEKRPEHEFAALLRAADETMGTVEIREGSGVSGVTVGALDLTVVAIKSEGEVETIPSRTRVLEPGETVYVVATPEEIRKFERSAEISA